MAIAPFPPANFWWIFEGNNVSSSANVALDDNSIEIFMAKRNMSGTYMLFVSNTVETVIGSFELNVQCKLNIIQSNININSRNF